MEQAKFFRDINRAGFAFDRLDCRHVRFRASAAGRFRGTFARIRRRLAGGLGR